MPRTRRLRYLMGTIFIVAIVGAVALIISLHSANQKPNGFTNNTFADNNPQPIPIQVAAQSQVPVPSTTDASLQHDFNKIKIGESKSRAIKVIGRPPDQTYSASDDNDMICIEYDALGVGVTQLKSN